jgi:hypothetical protein
MGYAPCPTAAANKFHKCATSPLNVPTEEYAETDALRAAEDARFVVSVAKSVVPPP